MKGQVRMRDCSSITRVTGRAPEKSSGWRRRAVPLAALLLAWGVGRGPAGAAPVEDPALESARLACETEILRRELELAKDGGFYIVLDSANRTLRIVLEGVTLTEYPVLRAEMGRPRLGGRSQSEGWFNRIWTGGKLVPARRHDHFEVIAPPVGADTTEIGCETPPTPEEAFPASSRFRIRYEEGVAIEVKPSRTGDELGLREAWFRRAVARFGRFLSALSPFGRDAVRVRVTLAPGDAVALYRSLPPETRLLVVLSPAEERAADKGR